MKTFTSKLVNVKKNWYIVDAKNKTLGRLSTRLAHYLRGKHKPEYTPHIDIGDYIIVLNADKIFVTGNKRTKKIYYRHTGYVGGIKEMTFEKMILTHPEYIIKNAVKGMLPKGALGRSILQKLKIYANNIHNHVAQNPKILDL